MRPGSMDKVLAYVLCAAFAASLDLPRNCQAQNQNILNSDRTHDSFGDRSEDWPEFRGPGGRGRYLGTHSLPSDISNDRALLWTVPAPEGHSSPIVVGDLVILTGHRQKQLVTIALDRRDGSERWSREIEVDSLEKNYHHGPATPTAVTDGKSVFVVFGSFGVLAYDLDGNEKWRDKWEPVHNLYGTAASPILADEKLIVVASDNARASLLAFDKESGKRIWERTGPGPASTWSSPVVIERSGQKLILVYEPFHLRAIDLSNGQEIWSVPGLADEPITVPQWTEDLVIVTSYNMATNREVIGIPSFETILTECDSDGDGRLSKVEASTNRSVLSRPDADGEGDHPLRIFFRMIDEDQNGFLEASEWPRLQAWVDDFKHANGFIGLRLGEHSDAPEICWQQEMGVPECPTPLIVGPHLFAVRNGGVVTCIDVDTGKTTFQDRLLEGGPYYSSPVYGDGKILFASTRGRISVVSATEKPTLLSTRELGEPVWATPAISGGVIFVRSKSKLWAFGARSD